MTRSSKDIYKFFIDIQTRWNDNDMYGHINNAVYYFWFDTLVNNFLIENEMLVLDHSKKTGGEQIGLVVDTGCQYFASLAYPETVVAGLRVAKIGTSSVRYEIGLFKQGENQPCAEGHFVHVYVDSETRKPKPIHAKMRACLETIT